MSSRKPTASCALCLQAKPLCDSHIIPEFCYKSVYDTKHRAPLLKSGTLRRILIQKGLRQPLLCKDCEQIINEYERYFKDFWFDKGALPATVNHPTITVQGLDYAPFKLFHLSVLWRAGVANIKDFSSVSLGPYAEKLRKLIHARNPGPEGLYPFFGMVMVNPDRSVQYGLVSGPYRSKLDSFTVYYMCYAGCEWTFIVTDHDCSRYSDWTIKKNAPLTLVARPIDQINTLKIFAEQRASHA